MIRKVLKYLGLVLLPYLSIGQCPTGDVILQKQSDVDSFFIKYPNCKTIDGTLIIHGDKVLDISPVAGIEFIKNLSIDKTGNIAGFNEFFAGIKRIDRSLSIRESDLDGTIQLKNLDNIGTIGVFECAFLDTLIISSKATNIGAGVRINDCQGLKKLSIEIMQDSISPFEVYVRKTPSLTDLEMFSFPKYIRGDVFLQGNFSVTEFSGFHNVEKIDGLLTLSSFLQLQNFSGFNNLKSVGRFDLYNVPAFVCSSFESLRYTDDFYFSSSAHPDTLLYGFNNLLEVRGVLDFHNLQVLKSIIGFEKLKRVDGGIGFAGLSNLERIDAFQSLDSIPAIEFSFVPRLKTLDFLEKLRYVEYGIAISRCHTLKNLKGLRNVDLSNLGDSMSGLIIYNNDSLSWCSEPNICAYVRDSLGPYSFHDNAPGCNTYEEIIAPCIASTDDHIEDESYIYPNPVSEILYFEENLWQSECTLYDIHGQLMVRSMVGDKGVDVSSLAPGLYFLVVETKQGDKHFSMLKN